MVIITYFNALVSDVIIEIKQLILLSIFQSIKYITELIKKFNSNQHYRYKKQLKRHGQPSPNNYFIVPQLHPKVYLTLFCLFET